MPMHNHSQKPASRPPQQRRKRQASLQQHVLRVRDVVDDVLYLAVPSESRKRSAHAIIEITATNYRLKSDEEQAAMVDGYRRLLRSLRFPLQILIRFERLTLLDYRESLNPDAQPARLRELAQFHQQDIETLATERALLDRHFYVIVPAQSIIQPLTSLLPFQSRRQQAQQELDEAQVRQELSSRTHAVVDHLSGMGLLCRRLRGMDLITLYQRALQGEEAHRFPLPAAVVETAHRPPVGHLRAMTEPGASSSETSPLEPLEQGTSELPASETAPPPTPLRALVDLLAPNHLTMHPDYLVIAEQFVRTLAVVGFPREVSDGWLTRLLQVDEPCDLVFHLTPQDSAAVVRQLQLRKARYASTQRLNTRRGVQEDPTLQVAETDVDRLLRQLASGEEHLLDVGMYLLQRAPSLHALTAQTARLRQLLSQLLLVAHPTTYEHLQGFQASLPNNHDPLGRTFSMSSTVLATTFPFVSDSLAMPNGVFVGATVHGEPVLLDPWTLDNPHEFYGGITGSGKSYMVKLRILHERLRGHPANLQQIIIDRAREYVPLAEMVGGTVLRLAPGSTHNLNPFDLIPIGLPMQDYLQATRHQDRLAEKVQKLHALLDIMLSDYTPEPNTLTAREKALLDRALYETYRRVGITAEPRSHDRQPPLLRDLYEVLRTGLVGSDDYALADRLERFVSGSMAGFFAHPTSIAADASLLVFDLREMSGARELRPIGMFLIADFVWTHALYAPRPRRCYIDEAWSLIEHQEGGRFLEQLAREARKYYLSLITITQNPEKFIENPHGSVIAQNALTKVLKRMDPVGAQAAREAFRLTREEEHRLMTLDQNKALLVVGAKRLLVEVTANAAENALMTTNPHDEQKERTL